MSSPPEKMVVMGYVKAAYGTRGWVSIVPNTQEPDGLTQYPLWWVQQPQSWLPCQVEQVSIHNRRLIAKLQHIEAREQAEQFKGSQIAISRQELPPLPDGEYYWDDLMGLEVVNLQHVGLGLVTQVLSTGANDVLITRDASGRERLIPYIDDVIRQVDLKTRRVWVDWDADF